MALSLDGTTGISASGNIWGNNIIVPGTLSVGAFSPASLSTSGNVTGNYILGNGSQLTGIDATSIQSGTSNVRVISSGGNVSTGIGGTADVVVVASTGQYVTGISSTSGNVIGGNLITAGVISATGNVTGNYILGNGSQLTGIDATSIQNGTANVRTFNNGNVTISAAGTANVLVVTSTGTITTGSATATGAITGNTLSAGGLTLTGNSIISTNSTITIDPNSAGGVDGAVIIAGNLSVQGNVTYIDSNVITTNEKSITLANNQNTGAAVDGSGIDVGNNSLAYWRYNNATTSWQSNISLTPAANTTLNLGGASNYWGNAFIVTASVAGNVTAGNMLTQGTISASGNIVTAGSFVGNFQGNITGNLTVPGSNTQVLFNTNGNADAVAGLTYTKDSNTLSILGVVSAQGNVIGGNVRTAGLITATGNVTGGNLLTGGLISATGNVTGGNLRTAGSLVTATISTTGNVIIDGYLTSAGMTVFAPGLLVANGIRNGSANGVSNIGESATVFNTLFIKDVLATGLVSAVGNTTAGNILTAGIMSSTGNGIHGNVLTGGLISATGAITGAAITGSSLTVSTGNVTCGNIVNANGNGVGNIGSSSLYFNTVFAKATSAQYADLAEKYVADAPYEPGTVLKFGGQQEVTMATEFDDTRVAGVVSTNPSYLMNAAQSGVHVVDIALQGRVPCKVRGPVTKGDLMVSGGSGHACANNQARAGTIIGKSLQDFTGEFGTIEIAIGRD